MPINNVVGSPVVGDNFFGRVQEQDQLWTRLAQDNVLLLAPRRVGKTSLLRRIEATAEQHDREAVYLSVADCTTEVGFLARLYESVARTTGGTKAAKAAFGRFVRRFPQIRKIDFAKIVSAEFEESVGAEWQGLGDELVRTLRATEHHWLFLVDELPLLVLALLRSSRDRARTFLAWFREARIDEQVRQSVRWVIAGSIGLDTVAARERLGDTNNDLAPQPLGPFPRPLADDFLLSLAHSHGLDLSDEARAAALDRVGWLIPYHLQLLFSVLQAGDNRSPGPTEVESAYQRLLEPAYRATFDWWVQRLPDELGAADGGHAHAVLGAVAVDEGGVSRDVLAEVLIARGHVAPSDHAFMLDALESDGYLVRVAGRYHFRSPLLRDYWRERVL